MLFSLELSVPQKKFLNTFSNLDHSALAAWPAAAAEKKRSKMDPKLSSVLYTCASCTLRELKSG